ncbi:hypothetical protein CTAYLR_009865 [Chrysophaeum taylorii]|uniref:Uncharacterized protein n=1 Tax=Chrysophaeum taylorii TaxID=2483200 RepID=A0AAD7U626_9STRA|nr:hypothetical protein CTAYLR_009865 [Chrysophaeum taylorii]
MSNLWTAASDGDLDRVSQLFDAGHATNDADEMGYTCLHAASSYGHRDLIEFLLARPDVDVNVRDADGDTPLHVCEDILTAKRLLEAGAEHAALNSLGFTPANVAREEGHAFLADFLDSLQSEVEISDERDTKRRR